MSTSLINPNEIEPLHEARIPALLRELAEDMEENGWSGRPLLVIERKSEYLAWTGSHRIAAARKAGLKAVPCYVVAELKLTRLGFDASWGHVMDYERFEILKKVGDATAIQLMWQEGRS